MDLFWQVEQKVWYKDLKQKWMKENFHEQLVEKFKSFLEAKESSLQIIIWLEQIPYQYWDSIEHKDIGQNHFHKIQDQIIEFMLSACDASLAKPSQIAALHYAASLGGARGAETAKQIIEKCGVDAVNELDSLGWNSLCFAIDSGSLKLTKLILDYGGSCDFSQAKYFCPFYGAVAYGQYDFFCYLMNNMGSSFGLHCARTQDLIHGKTCAQEAAYRKRKGMMYYITDTTECNTDVLCTKLRSLSNYDRVFCHANTHRNSRGPRDPDEVLTEICDIILELADEKIIKILLEARGRRTLLESGHLLGKLIGREKGYKYFKFILKFSLRDERVPYGSAASIGLNELLYDSVCYGNLPTANFLLKVGADIKHREDKDSLLEIAIQKKNAHMISFLLLRGAEIDDPTSLLTKAISTFTSDQGADVEVIHLILKYIAISEFSEEQINDENTWYLEFSGDMRNFYKICQNELLLMTNRPIYDSITFFSVLKNAKQFSGDYYVREAFENEDTPNTFPIYFDLLRKHFNLVRKRPYLITQAKSGLEKIMMVPADAFPIIFENILANLGCKDLRTLSLI